MTTGAGASSGDPTLQVIIEAVDRASATIRSISGRLAAEVVNVGRRMAILGGIVTGFATIAVMAALGQQAAQNQLRAIVEAQGGSWALLEEKVKAAVAELDHLSKFSKTDLLGALQAGVTAVGNLDAALRILPAAVALASGTGMGLKAAMDTITAAINGDDGARQALQNLGIDVRGVGGRFEELITRIEQKYGPAVAAANTPSAQLSKSIKEIGIAIGLILEPFLVPFADAMVKIADIVQRWANLHPQLTAAVTASIVGLAALAVAIGAIVTTIGLVAPAVAVASKVLGIAIGSTIIAGLVEAFSIAAIAYELTNTVRELWSGRDVTDIGLKIALELLGTAIGWTILGPIGGFVGLELGKILAEAMDKNSPGMSSAIHSAEIAGVLIGGALFGPIGLAIATATAGVIELIRYLKQAQEESRKIQGQKPFVPIIPPGTIPGMPGPKISAVNPAFEAMLAATAAAVGGTYHPPPTVAAGGIVMRPTMAIVGEAGPEAIIPLNRARGFGNITVNIDATHAVIGVDDLTELILRTVRSAATGGGFNAVFQGR